MNTRILLAFDFSATACIAMFALAPEVTAQQTNCKPLICKEFAATAFGLPQSNSTNSAVIGMVCQPDGSSPLGKMDTHSTISNLNSDCKQAESELNEIHLDIAEAKEISVILTDLTVILSDFKRSTDTCSASEEHASYCLAALTSLREALQAFDSTLKNIEQRSDTHVGRQILQKVRTDIQSALKNLGEEYGIP